MTKKQHSNPTGPLPDALGLAIDPADDYPLTAVLEVRLDSGSPYRLHPRTHDLLAKVLSRRGPVLAQSGDLVRVVYGAAGPDIEAGYTDAMGVVEDILATVGLAGAPVTGLHVTAPRTEPARTPVFVGLREAADILGVSRQRAAQLAKRPDFPEPLQRLRATPVWLESDVRQFHLERRPVAHAVD